MIKISNKISNIDESRIKLLKPLFNPLRYQIVEFVESQIQSPFKSIRSQFSSISTGSLYHHLRALKNFVTQDESKNYLLRAENHDLLLYYREQLDSKVGNFLITQLSHKKPSVKHIFHPVRRNILLFIEQEREVGFGKLRKNLDLNSGVLFYHLQKLSSAKFIAHTKNKKYKITKKGIQALNFLSNEAIASRPLDEIYEASQIVKQQPLAVLNVWHKHGDYTKIIESVRPGTDTIYESFILVDSLLAIDELEKAETIISYLLDPSNISFLDGEKEVFAKYYEALCLKSRGAYTNAINKLNTVITKLTSLSSENKRILEYKFNSSLHLGECLWRVRNQQASKDIFYNLEQHWNELTEDQRGLLYDNLLAINWIKGNHSKAEYYGIQALQFYKTNINPLLKGMVKSKLGLVYRSMSKLTLSEKFQKESISDFEVHGNDSRVAAALTNLGLIYNDLAQYDLALNNYERALQLLEKTANPNALMIILNNIATIHQHQGNYDKALTILNKALKLSELVENVENIGLVTFNIGRVNSDRGYLSYALNMHYKALENFEKAESTHWIGKSLHMIAQIYYTQGNYKMALDYFQRALNTKQKHTVEAEELADSLTALSYVYADQNKFTKAHQLLTQADEWIKQVNPPRIKAALQAGHGHLEFLQGNFTKALRFYTEALEYAEKINHPVTNAEKLVEIAKTQIFGIHEKFDLDLLKKFPDYTNNPLLESYYNLLIGLQYYSNENWELAKDYFTKSLNSIDYSHILFCYELLTDIEFRLWQLQPNKSTIITLEELIKQWELFCLENDIVGGLTKIKYIKTKIKIINFQFEDSRMLLSDLLEESRQIGALLIENLVVADLDFLDSASFEFSDASKEKFQFKQIQQLGSMIQQIQRKELI